MMPKYKQGWNDRVRKTAEDYGAVYMASGDRLVVNRAEAKDWTLAEKADYVKGWNEASAKIAALEIV